MQIRSLPFSQFNALSKKFPADLLSDLEAVQKYQLVFEEVDLNRTRLFYIRPVNFDTILDNYIHQYNDSDYIPYWADFWPSASIMVFQIYQNYDFHSQEVLELGSGNGISGLSVPLKGGRIICSDYDPNSFPFIRINHYINHHHIPEILTIDWTKRNPKQAFDWIIASDLAYEKRLFKPLINTLNLFLSKQGKILLTEPERSFAKPFFQLLEQSGFSYQKKILEGKNNSKDIMIGFYEIMKREQGNKYA